MRQKMKTTGCKYIDDYANDILSGKIPAGKRLKKAMKYILAKLDNDDIFIDVEKTEKAKDLIEEHFEFELLPWQLFVLSLIHCFYISVDKVVFRKFLIVMGRGNGKNGFISALSWYFTTPAHGIKRYNVDIVANSKEQAATSFNDIYEMLEDGWDRLKRYFYKTLKMIKNLRTASVIRYHAANAKTKEGGRTACLVLDEIDMYEDDSVVKAFEGGLGKKKHSRIFEITTEGDHREGYLDDERRQADQVLNGLIANSSMCPLFWEIDEEHQAKDRNLWEMANPSLPYFPELQIEMDEQFALIPYSSSAESLFYTKRMNFPKRDRELIVASREEILDAGKPLPDLVGKSCVCGIDYAQLSDMASVGLWFKQGEQRYWIQHSWFCKNSADWNRVKKTEKMQTTWSNQVTVVDDVEISPYLIANKISEWMTKYHIVKIALDKARLALIRKALESVGIYIEETREKSMVVFVRRFDLVSVGPVIESIFRTGSLSWGENNEFMNWNTNNTGRKQDKGNPGNYLYYKIEARSRKNDAFMAMVHAATIESEIPEDDYLEVFDPIIL